MNTLRSVVVGVLQRVILWLTGGRLVSLSHVRPLSLSHVRPLFEACPTCEAKPGSPTLCRECLERRDLYTLVKPDMICRTCSGTPDPECPRHGR